MILQMLFNLEQITVSSSNFRYVLCFEISQSNSIFQKELQSYLSGSTRILFLEQMILQNYLLFKSKGKLPQELVLKQELQQLQCSDSLVSLNSHQETIILRECLG
ncbi:Hypothetical_protein [Hexamita inflata]|uniref:Hypothetical_protein n=1 Tax=Hexamita inflata TaxID=28002 RepID=A0AA86R7R1_9EUKA|nr:Hypothetical protein HINF_LOCUS58662 [Hexamita inflata]